jgi:hypothetical protein
MSASLNGQDIVELVTSDLDSPDGLAIDYFMDGRLYWCDHKQHIVETIKPDGSDRVRISHVGLTNPYKIDIFENQIYSLSQYSGSLNKLDKFGRGAFVNIINGLDLVSDIKVFHSYKVPQKSRFNVRNIKLALGIWYTGIFDSIQFNTFIF